MTISQRYLGLVTGIAGIMYPICLKIITRIAGVPNIPDAGGPLGDRGKTDRKFLSMI